VHSLSSLPELARDQTVKVVGMIIDVKRIQTKKGDPMAFLTIEDKTAQVETVVFPQVFAKYAELLGKERLIVLEGRVDFQDDSVKLLASRIWDAAALPKPTTEPVLFIKISPEQERDSTLSNLQKLIVEKKGTISVVLYYESKKQSIRLPDSSRVTVDESFLEQARAIVGSNSVIQKEMPINWGG
jgi:DNA polymerase-3 subunit alpha